MYEQASHSSNVRISFAMSTLATVILNPAERNLHNAPWYFLFTVLCQVLVGRGRGGLSDNNMEVAMFWIMVFEEWRTRKYGFVPIISDVRICWGILHREFDRPVSMSCNHRSEDVWTLESPMDHHFHNCLPFSRVPSYSTSRPIKPHSWLHHRGSEVFYEPPHLSNCPCCEN